MKLRFSMDFSIKEIFLKSTPFFSIIKYILFGNCVARFVYIQNAELERNYVLSFFNLRLERPDARIIKKNNLLGCKYTIWCQCHKKFGNVQSFPTNFYHNFKGVQM